jgi:hypothetical protein
MQRNRIRTGFLVLVAALSLGLSGCERAAEIIGLKETAEQKQERIQKTAAADELVDGFAKQLGEKTSSSGGFIRHEGLTPADPWGNRLTVSYEQVWATEVLTVRSSGPDQRMENGDDLVRVKETSNFGGILSGIPTGYAFLFGWLGLGVLACLLSSLLSFGRQRKDTRRGGVAHPARRRRIRRYPVLGFFATCLAGPLAFAFYGFMLAGFAVTSLFGADFDFFDDFDFGDIGGGDGGGVDIDVDF